MDGELVLAAIATAKNDFVAYYRQGNSAALTSFYTADGLILPPNSSPIKGNDAIQNFWQSLMDMGIETIGMQVSEMEIVQDIVIEISDFNLIGPGPSIIDNGNHLAIWKQVAGQWKISKDIFNSNRPAQ